MKKLFTSLVLSLCLVFSISTVTFAAGTTTAKDLQSKLQEIGVSSAYVGNIVEYLQKIEISEAQANELLVKVDEALAIIGDATNLALLSNEDKSSLKDISIEAGRILGLNVAFGKDSKGQTTVLVTDKNGNVVIEANTELVMNMVTNFKASTIVLVIKSAIDFSNNPEKGKFDPISGELNNTGTNNKAVMMTGLGIMTLGGAGFLALRKFS